MLGLPPDRVKTVRTRSLKVSGLLMLKLFLVNVATVGLFGASALAADLPVKAPAYDNPAAAPPYNWSGPYLGATTPIITSNWLAAPGQQWTVPVGGGFGRVFTIGDQPVNAQV